MQSFPQKSLTVKLQCARILTTDQIKLVVRHLPRDSEQLNKLVPELTDVDERAKVLAITSVHERDQARFLECVSVLRAYARGGEYGMHLLNKLHDVVIAHYSMQNEKWEVLIGAGVTMDFELGALVLTH